MSCQHLVPWMQRIVCGVLMIVAAQSGISWSKEPDLAVRVMSFNIRYGTAKDGPNAWPLRRDALVETIKKFDPDMLGTQETLAEQRDFLLMHLEGYTAVGVGRDDGGDEGEMAALFYRTERYEDLGSGHFWLSESPEKIGSKGWDAALPRIATWVKLRDRRAPDAVPILFLNTHFDHRGEQARTESARLIRTKLADLGRDCRWIVTGDFNADPTSTAYTNMFASHAEEDRRLIDTYRVHYPTKQDHEGTFSGFDAKQVDGSRIDWIGCSAAFEVQSAGIDRTSTEGRPPSDHFPVTAVLR